MLDECRAARKQTRAGVRVPSSWPVVVSGAPLLESVASCRPLPWCTWKTACHNRVRFSPADLFLVPFSIMWAGFVIVWGFGVIGRHITVGRFIYKKRPSSRPSRGSLTRRRSCCRASDHSPTHPSGTRPSASAAPGTSGMSRSSSAAAPGGAPIRTRDWTSSTWPIPTASSACWTASDSFEGRSRNRISGGMVRPGQGAGVGSAAILR